MQTTLGSNNSNLSETKLKITTLNIENFNTNKVLLSQLLQKNDIVCIQEHWLFSFEKSVLEEFAQSCGFLTMIKCSDENEPIGPKLRPRGKGGVCVMWKSGLDEVINQQPDGGERFAVIEVFGSLCIINVYLTARGTPNSDTEFQEQLAEITEIITKFRTTHEIILLGDLNASLHRNKNIKRDQIFRNFCKSLQLCNPLEGNPVQTFFHNNQKDTSQIDYILASKTNIVNNLFVVHRDPTNTSSHDPVCAELTVLRKDSLQMQTAVENSVLDANSAPKICWKDVDTTKYSEQVSVKLADSAKQCATASELLEYTTSILSEAARDCLITQNSPAVKKNIKRISPSILSLAKQSKRAHWKVKMCKGHDSLLQSLKIEEKLAKKQLR